jgi:hypothetical protein
LAEAILETDPEVENDKVQLVKACLEDIRRSDSSGKHGILLLICFVFEIYLNLALF